MAEAKLLRAVYSERQLEEVLVDFWFNHFNVFARKGQTEIYVGEYEREAIRPHVLGSFRELLGATAKSPAMLFYLDNWMSADPNAASRTRESPATERRRQAARASALGGAATWPQNRRIRNAPDRMRARAQRELRARAARAAHARRRRRLHAAGRRRGRARVHRLDDRPARRSRVPLRRRPCTIAARRRCSGRRFAAGGGIEDGEKVLDILARHPATARHIAFKLAQRFVSDTPPHDLVDRAAETFTRTNGNLREVVRTIVTSPEFFAPEAYRAKVKTPFEFVASALRATGADVRSGDAIVRALAGLGMPLYLCQPPTGYDETADTWVSSGALVNRMNFALAIAGGQMRGVSVSRRSSDGVRRARERIVRDALGGDVSTATLETMAKAATVEQAIALVIGSPEFQRQ